MQISGFGRGIRTQNTYTDDPAQDMSAKRKSQNLFIFLRHRLRRCDHHHGRWLVAIAVALASLVSLNPSCDIIAKVFVLKSTVKVRKTFE